MSPGGCGGEAGDVAELVRGSVTDRPWGRTFAAFGLRGVTGQLTLARDGKRFLVAFESGAVVAASSPLASDAAVRVALTSHLVSSSQVSEVTRRQAAAPERDEIELIAELARLGPDHALRLRRRVIAQRAARTFSVNHGEFVVTDHTELPILPGCELDIRAVIYMGARTNLSEQRLSAELDQLGSWFRLKPGVDVDLPQFGFTDLEQPVVERLRDGGTLSQIEEFATSFVDGRTVHAAIYSLAVCGACELGPASPRSVPARGTSSTLPPLAAGQATGGASGAARPPTSPSPPRAQTPVPPAQLAAGAPPGSPRTPSSPTPSRQPAVPPGVLAAGSAVFAPISEGFAETGRSPAHRARPEAPDQRGEATLRDASSPGLRLALEEATLRDASSPGLQLALDGAVESTREPVSLRVPAAHPPRSTPRPTLRSTVGSTVESTPRSTVGSAPRSRQVRPTDAPLSHDVKALIAQRLKLLDQGADHFQLLGVAQDAAQDALCQAYFALARQLHPDRLAALGIPDDGKHAQRLFAQINAGFATLSDPGRRARYLDVVRRGGEAAVRAEEVRAEELARRILDAEEAFRRGELALRRDQPQVAVAEFERAIQLNPDEADYHALFAWSQFCAAPDRMAVAPKTRSLLDRAIQRAPRSVTARLYLGRVERMLGRDPEALRHFREVLEAAPGHAEAASELRVIEARLAGGGDRSGGGLPGRPRR